MAKLIAVLGLESDGLSSALKASAVEQFAVLRQQLDDSARVDLYTWIGEEDLMANRSDTIRPPALSLEISAPPGTRLATLLPSVRDFIAPLRDDIDPRQSTVLYGVENVVVPGGPDNLCYRYLMRRRDDMCYAEYIDYYVNIHAKFGLETPEISGYRQLHVDHDASRLASESSGVAWIPYDSVTELHMASLERFIQAVATSEVAPKAAEDETHFVRGASSQMFTSVRHPA
jgi:hypothetical protein